jgi:hypothetical protein
MEYVQQIGEMHIEFFFGKTEEQLPVQNYIKGMMKTEGMKI